MEALLSRCARLRCWTALGCGDTSYGLAGCNVPGRTQSVLLERLLWRAARLRRYVVYFRGDMVSVITVAHARTGPRVTRSSPPHRLRTARSSPSPVTTVCSSRHPFRACRFAPVHRPSQSSTPRSDFVGTPPNLVNHPRPLSHASPPAQARARDLRWRRRRKPARDSCLTVGRCPP